MEVKLNELQLHGGILTYQVEKVAENYRKLYKCYIILKAKLNTLV